MRDLAPYRAGSTEPWAADVVAALARVTKAKRILELGTFQGMTTRKLAEVAYVTTIDKDKRWDGELPATFVQDDAIHFLSTTAGTWDFVFVDDDHTKAHVATELDLLMAGVATRWIVMHDVLGPFGLDTLVHDRGGFIIELPHLHVAGSLGVIEV